MSVRGQLPSLVNSALLAVLLALGACAAQAAAPGPRALIPSGRQIVQRDCSACHATERLGSSPNAAAPRFRDLSQRYDVENLAEALAEGILVGHSPMPERSYPPEEVTAIIAYVKSLSPKPPVKVTARP